MRRREVNSGECGEAGERGVGRSGRETLKALSVLARVEEDDKAKVKEPWKAGGAATGCGTQRPSNKANRRLWPELANRILLFWSRLRFPLGHETRYVWVRETAGRGRENARGRNAADSQSLYERQTLCTHFTLRNDRRLELGDSMLAPAIRTDDGFDPGELWPGCRGRGIHTAANGSANKPQLLIVPSLYCLAPS